MAMAKQQQDENVIFHNKQNGEMMIEKFYIFIFLSKGE
jgi:hypothetical protein